MAKKKTIRMLNAIKDYLTPLKVTDSFYSGPRLEKYESQRQQEASWRQILPRASRYSTETIFPDNEEAKMINDDIIKLSQLDHDRDALNLNLKSQHRLMIATLITALVAFLASCVALYTSAQNKPPVVYDKPNISVQPPVVYDKPNITVNMPQ